MSYFLITSCFFLPWPLEYISMVQMSKIVLGRSFDFYPSTIYIAEVGKNHNMKFHFFRSPYIKIASAS